MSPCPPGEPRGAASRDESAPLWMLSRAPHGAEATAPGQHRLYWECCLVTAPTEPERQPQGGKWLLYPQGTCETPRHPRHPAESHERAPRCHRRCHCCHSGWRTARCLPSPQSHSGSSAPDLGKLRHGGQPGVTAGHSLAVLMGSGIVPASGTSRGIYPCERAADLNGDNSSKAIRG